MNNYQKYKNDAIYSMSPVELLILLYDECNKNFRKAKIALQEDDYTLFESTLGRNQKIIMYLIKTLDMEYPISRDLRRLYDYILFDIGTRVTTGTMGRLAFHLRSRDAYLRQGHRRARQAILHGEELLGQERTLQRNMVYVARLYGT